MMESEINVDIRIMGSHKRTDMIANMLKQLNMGEDIVTYDDRPDGGSAWHVAKKVWSLPWENYTHRLVLQDDLELCNNFVEIVNKAVTAFPQAAWSLMNWRLKPEDRKTTTPYIWVKGGLVYGQAIIMPKDVALRFLQWAATTLPINYKHDDAAIGEFLHISKVPVITTIPSTVQHLAPNKSLLGYNSYLKISKVWEGQDVIDNDWDAKNVVKSKYQARFKLF